MSFNCVTMASLSITVEYLIHIQLFKFNWRDIHPVASNIHNNLTNLYSLALISLCEHAMHTYTATWQSIIHAIKKISDANCFMWKCLACIIIVSMLFWAFSPTEWFVCIDISFLYRYACIFSECSFLSRSFPTVNTLRMTGKLQLLGQWLHYVDFV